MASQYKEKKETELGREKNLHEMLNFSTQVSDNDELLEKWTGSKTCIHVFDKTAEKNGKPAQGKVQYKHQICLVKFSTELVFIYLIFLVLSPLFRNFQPDLVKNLVGIASKLFKIPIKMNFIMN